MATTDTIVANDPAPLVADDVTSDYGESLASSTQSLSESIVDHVYENGRRYHRKSLGKYHLPSDETELDRLDLTHHLNLELLGGKIYLAEFKEDPPVVLDCGTGTGIWALDFGDQHPGSKVYGVDLAPIQPGWSAPNVKFELDDLELDWNFSEKFDYIHSRDLVTAIKDWPRYFGQMYKFSKPGAVVEISEHDMNWLCDDDTMPKDGAIQQWCHHFQAGLQAMGLHPENTLDKYKSMLEDAGFVDVQTHAYKMPAGTWPRNAKAKRLGAIIVELLKTGVESYGKSLMVHGAGLDDHAADAVIKNCVAAMLSNKEHVYYMSWHLVARKPE